MKVLVSTYPYAGHFNPTQPVVRELVRRGHEVVWMTGPAYEARVLQTGARFVAMSDDALIDDAHIHQIEGKVTLAKVADYLRRLFLDRIPAQVRDYRAVLEGAGGSTDAGAGGEGGDHPEKRQPGFAADVLVVDFCTYAARCYHDLAGLPYATLGINPLVTLDPEVPPWGSGEQPPRTAARRLRNRVRHQLGIVFFISRLSAAFNRQRRALGLPPRSRWRSYADDVRSPDLHIMMTTPAFEFPRRNMLPSVQFVGPLLPAWLEGGGGGGGGGGNDAARDGTKDEDKNKTDKNGGTDSKTDAKTEEWPTPAWWDEMLAHPRERVVHLTQGTIAVNTELLVKPTVEALADRDDLLVIITGKNVDAMFENQQPPEVGQAAEEQPKETPSAEGENGTAAEAPTTGASDTTGSAPVDAGTAPTPGAADAPAAPATPAAPTTPKMKRPANVRTAAFVPHLRLLPHVGVMVTNAGYNGVLAALSCGVPLVCAGRSEDKADVSSRVAWSGAGIDLATSAPTAAAVRTAVLRIIGGGSGGSGGGSGGGKEAGVGKEVGVGYDPLHGPSHDYRAAAKRIQDDFARHDGPAEAVDLLEALVRRTKAGEKEKKVTWAGKDVPKKKKKLQPKPQPKPQ